MSRHFLLPFLLALVGVMPLLGFAKTKPPPVPADSKVGFELTGSNDDDSLMGQASEAVVTQKGMDRLAEAWKLQNLPVIDFKREFVVVATSRSAQLLLTTRLDDKGNLKFERNESKDIARGFRYAIRSVRREGVAMVNGRPLPTE